MLLTENKNGDVKERSMFNGKHSRVWKTKEDTDSPNAANQSIMITAAICSNEEIDVVVVYVPNKFIQTKFPTNKRQRE